MIERYLYDYMDEISHKFEWFFDKGYITHRDGNACVSLKAWNVHNDITYLVTASGAYKPRISEGDYLIVDPNGKSVKLSQDPIDTRKPSIETMAHIHAQDVSKKTASIHVHSPNTVALFAGFKNHERLEKMLNNDWPEVFRYTKVGKTVPFLDPGSEALHDGIKESFELDKPQIVVLNQHGVLAVGENINECVEHIVRLEHVSSIMLKSGILQGVRNEP